ncbi:hypothetical protein D7Y41_29330 [Anaerotruncus sp. 1XD22-93]|nr:hypothetical protein [Lachnospiraceae bacterium]NBI76617.1 hypothetical protein [Lachnospiraceae bacterium]RKJ78519.1 hypothetical protein D7Y41_29330 [Anaerotruncus sp. 1XD22-93]
MISVRQTRALPPAFFRFHLTMDTLALGYTLPTTRACYGLSPIRLRPYWAHKRNGGSDFSKPPKDSIGVLIGLLYDGFFSFAVVRQIYIFTILKI